MRVNASYEPTGYEPMDSLMGEGCAVCLHAEWRKPEWQRGILKVSCRVGSFCGPLSPRHVLFANSPRTRVTFIDRVEACTRFAPLEARDAV